MEGSASGLSKSEGVRETRTRRRREITLKVEVSRKLGVEAEEGSKGGGGGD